MIATLGGFHLDASQTVSWTLVEGTRAHQQLFLMAKGDAEKLVKQDGPVSLIIDGTPDYPRLEVKDLYVMSIQPASDPAHRLALVVDKRIWWQRSHVLRRYNMVRRGPDTRRLEQEGVVADFNLDRNLKSDLVYAKWSLHPREKPEDPWTAQQVLEDVISAVEPGRIQYDAVFAKSSAIQNLTIDDPGDSAIGQALKFIPGACIYVNASGAVVIYNEHNGGEAGGILSAKPPLVGPPLANVISLAKSRPVAIEVLFGRELEVRFDSRVESNTSTVSAGLPRRELINVLPVTDFLLRVNGKVKTTGTWIPFEDAFTAWAGTWPAGYPDVNHEIVRRNFCTPSFIDSYARMGADAFVDPTLIRRLSECVKNYRQTFQILREWMDKILSIKAYRVGILDTENGTRASAQAFGDYALAPTFRGLARVRSGNTNLIYNVLGYEDLLTNARVCPATVKILDDDQGIVRLDYMLDQNGLYARIFPSKVVGPDGTTRTIPTFDMRETESSSAMLEDAMLSAIHRVAVVLTAVPAAPNDERQLYAHRVEKVDAEAALGISIGECRGPVWRVRVSEALMQARWEWLDSKSQAVEKAFGVEGGAPNLSPTTVTKGADPLGIPNNNESVKACAEAVAAAIYSAFLDRGEGNHVVVLNPNLHPIGSASAVTHQLEPDGKALTIASMPGRVEPFDMMALLPEAVRALVQRIVQ